MTFNPLMGLMVAKVAPLVPEPKTVCEFGNQRLTVSEAVYREIGMAARPNSTAAFYGYLGFTRYAALDVNEAMSARIADLNEPVDVGEQFALVTNNGTGEHIFDQASVFRNAHNLCRSGGVMLHVLPVSPWLNHGFYNFNPVLFRDLAAANGYGWLFLKVGNRGGITKAVAADWGFVEKRPEALSEVMRAIPGDVSVIAAYRKTSDAPFRKPVQGKYAKDIASDELARRYA